MYTSWTFLYYSTRPMEATPTEEQVGLYINMSEHASGVNLISVIELRLPMWHCFLFVVVVCGIYCIAAR